MERDPDRQDPLLDPAGLAESFQPIVGRAVTLRPLRREDHDIELDFVTGLSAETRHNRLLGGAVRITREYIERLTTVDLARDMALAAVVMLDDREALIGVARYVLVAGDRNCEFAIVIADAWQGRGIARRLMEKLIGVARARGLARIYGDVLSTNVRMLDFCRRLGFQPAHLPEDPTVTRVTLAL